MNAKTVIKKVIEHINNCNVNEMCIMEVCGTHTQAISQTGIRSMLAPDIRLLSGPGCPVCVTDESYIDAAIQILNKYNIILATFGDMMHVKGTDKSLLDQFNKRKNIVVVYSPLDVITLAKKNNDKQVMFLAVGFETTAPLIAMAVKMAYKEKLDNLSFLTSLKIMPPILHAILKQKNKRLDGIICPGHVAAVKGADYFRFIARDYGIPAAICGFDALDVVSGIYYLIEQNTCGRKARFGNLYKACVSNSGNMTANQLMQEVFELGNAKWRGIGEIQESALTFRSYYSYFDALKRFKIDVNSQLNKQQCNCGDVLLGNILPNQCKLFGSVCNPQNPKGPCMVSGEGACSIYYRYRGG